VTVEARILVVACHSTGKLGQQAETGAAFPHSAEESGMGGDQLLSWQKMPAKAPAAAIFTAIPPMAPPGSRKRPSVSPCSVTTPQLTRTRALQMVVIPVPRYRDEDKEAADGRVDRWRRPAIGGMCDSGMGQYHSRWDVRLSPTRDALAPGADQPRVGQTRKRNVTENRL
jgi:hypothetical protein